MSSLVFIFAAFLAIGLATEQVAIILPCEEVNNSFCTINEVRIDPCNANKQCVFRKGVTAHMTVDFTPSFDTSNLKLGLYGHNGISDVLFDGLKSTNGCDFTTCPTQTGQPQTLEYSLQVGRKLPRGSFLFKYKLWNVDNESQMCCFRTNVQIRK